MYIQPYKDKFRAFERYKDPHGVVKIASVTMPKNTPQARKEAQKRLNKIIAQRSTPSTEIKLSGLVNAYINYQEKVTKKSTWTRNQTTLEHLANDIIGDVPLQDLTAGFIRNKLLDYTKNPCTLNEYIRRLKTMLRWAYKNDYIRDTKIVDKLDNFKDDEKKQRIQDKYLEKEELREVIAAASGYYANVIEFMALSGLRSGEVVALLDEDVTDTVIRVNKTYDYRNDETTTPKTSNSVREVHIQPELKAVISRIRHDSRIYRLRTRERYNNFILSSWGTPLSYTKFNRVFGDLTEKTIGRRLTTHALRHTHVSLLAEAGVPLSTIARRCGHGDSKITEEIYLHITKNVRERDNEMLDQVSFL